MADSEFEQLWNLAARVLDAPNRRGSGTSTVAVVEPGDWPLAPKSGRIYLKRQQAFFCRPPWNSFRRAPTLRREQRFLERARSAGINVPRIAYYGEGSGDRAILAVEAVVGAADLERALSDADATKRTEILERVGAALATLHAARVTHGALYPKHILVAAGPAHTVTLIDFEKGRDMIARHRSARRDLDRLARHAPFLTAGDWAVLKGRYESHR